MRSLGRNLKYDICPHHTERDRAKCLCDRMNNMPHIPGFILIQLLIIAIYDLCSICTIRHGNRKERVPEHHIILLHLLLIQIIQNQQDCKKYDTENYGPYKVLW